MCENGSWVAVDLDGVLAWWDVAHFPEIGAPIPKMVARVKGWLEAGIDVRIFTARVAVVPGLRNDEGQEADDFFAADQKTKIDAWCRAQFGRPLPVTATKDFKMAVLYDDRCVQMLTNTGQSLAEGIGSELRALNEILMRTN